MSNQNQKPEQKKTNRLTKKSSLLLQKQKHQLLLKKSRFVLNCSKNLPN